MKTLILARHAKSSWGNPEIDDFNRPLNSRGHTNAPAMAAVLKQQCADLDLIISSDAVRALSTAEVYAQATGLAVELRRDLYLASEHAIIDTAQQIHNSFSCAMLVGHNPGMTLAMNRLSLAGIENMPTCSFAVIEFDIDSWSQLAPSQGRLITFEYPAKSLNTSV